MLIANVKRVNVYLNSKSKAVLVIYTSYFSYHLLRFIDCNFVVKHELT